MYFLNDKVMISEANADLLFGCSSMDVLKRIASTEVLAASHLLWTDRFLADEIGFQAREIINQAYQRKFSFFNGRKSKWIVGGLFYLLSYRYNSIRKQKEIANKLGTSECTIRDSYRLWVKSFPDLFADVITKFEKDEMLRYFVLIDLKKKELVA